MSSPPILLLNINWPHREIAPSDIFKVFISIPNSFSLNELYTKGSNTNRDM